MWDEAHAGLSVIALPAIEKERPPGLLKYTAACTQQGDVPPPALQAQGKDHLQGRRLCERIKVRRLWRWPPWDARLVCTPGWLGSQENQSWQCDASKQAFLSLSRPRGSGLHPGSMPSAGLLCPPCSLEQAGSPSALVARSQRRPPRLRPTRRCPSQEERRRGRGNEGPTGPTFSEEQMFGLLWRASGWDSELPIQGARVQSPISELDPACCKQSLWEATRDLTCLN